MAMVFFAVVAFSASAWAQASPVSHKDVSDALTRLDALMQVTEQQAQYAAPANDDEEIFAALERLDLWAVRVENEIRYTAPDENQFSAGDYVAEENNPTHAIPNENAFQSVYAEKK